MTEINRSLDEPTVVKIRPSWELVDDSDGKLLFAYTNIPSPLTPQPISKDEMRERFIKRLEAEFAGKQRL